MYAQILFGFFEYVLQGRWGRHSVRYGEGKSHCLTGSVVGVLTQNHNFYLVQWSELKGLENLASRRIYGLAFSLLAMQTSCKLCKVWSFELALQSFFPAFFDSNVQR